MDRKPNVAPGARWPGLLVAWRLQAGEPAEALDEGQFASAVVAGDDKLWIHLDLTEPRSREIVFRLALPAAAKRALLELDEVPHLDEIEGVLSGALGDFQYDTPAAQIAPVALLQFVLSPDLLITGRREKLRVAELVSHGPAGDTPADVLAQLLRGTAGAVGQAVQQLSKQLSDLEDALLKGGGTQEDRQALAGLRRSVLRIERVFAPTAETLSHWEADPSGTLAEPFCAPVLREARRHAAIDRALHGLHERARIAQDELAALAAEETNDRLFVLSVISAVMLPASLITGIFGMNVGALPGVDQPWGFAMAMGLIAMSIIGVLGALRVAKLL